MALDQRAEAFDGGGVDIVDAQHGVGIAHGDGADLVALAVDLERMQRAILGGIEG